MLQAQRVSGDKTPLGTWSIGSAQYDQNNYKLLRCDHDDDTITHKNSGAKVQSVTFGWHPPSTQVGNITFM